MNKDHVSIDRWLTAQNWELKVWLNSSKDSEDWNHWWFQKFFNFEILKTYSNLHSLIEIGCGPYGKNTSYLCSVINSFEKVDFLDPLLNQYINNNFSITKQIEKFNSKTYSTPLENLNTNETYDCVLCINVLDHVYDAKICMQKMLSLLKPKGIFILGQDLTNTKDIENNSEILKDIGHPILLDYNFFEPYFINYTEIFRNILPRIEGRNPDAHYGTLLYIGQKK